MNRRKRRSRMDHRWGVGRSQVYNPGPGGWTPAPPTVPVAGDLQPACSSLVIPGSLSRLQVLRNPNAPPVRGLGVERATVGDLLLADLEAVAMAADRHDQMPVVASPSSVASLGQLCLDARDSESAVFGLDR